MGAITDLHPLKLWYRVFHADFDASKAYRAIAYIDYGESAWSQILFINDRGMTYAVQVKHAVCLSAGREKFYRDLDDWERTVTIPKSNLKE